MPEAVADGEAAKVFSLEDVKKHNTEESCWLIIHGKVYDITKVTDDRGGDPADRGARSGPLTTHKPKPLRSSWTNTRAEAMLC